MITQKRAAYQSNSKIAEFAGRSIDEKPINVENGSEYTEIDTGRVYSFDAENAKWIEKQSSGGGGGGGTTDYNALTNKPSIAGKTLQGNMSLADIGAMQAIDIDTTPTENSSNLITSGGVEESIKATKIELAAKSVPAGGTKGQVLQKSEDDDYSVEWADVDASIAVDGVLVGDGSGNITGRQFDDAPTKDSDNMLTSGATYATYSNVLAVVDNEIKTKDNTKTTSDVQDILGITPAAILTGTLPAGQTELGLTDSRVDENVTIQLYTDVYGVVPLTVKVENNTIAMTFAEQEQDISVRAEIGEVTWTEPVEPVDQGDMRKAVYDSVGVVASAGGISAYVNNQTVNKQNITDDSLTTTNKTVAGAINELKSALDAIGKVATIKVVDARPETPTDGTLYYVGTTNPYHIWLYSSQWYDMGTTEINLDEYVKQTLLVSELEKKQDALTDEQMNAVNSGVTAEVLANKAESDLSNITDSVFKEKVENCGVILGASKPSTVDVTQIFSFYGALYQQAGNISEEYKYAYIKNGALVWGPYVSKTSAQTLGFRELFETKSNLDTFVDSAGQKWRVARPAQELDYRGFANMVNGNNYFPSVNVSRVRTDGSVYTQIHITSEMVGKTNGINFNIEIPLERVE